MFELHYSVDLNELNDDDDDDDDDDDTVTHTTLPATAVALCH